MADETEHIFPVRRRLVSALGWFMACSGAISLLVFGLWIQNLSHWEVLKSLIAVMIGVYLIRTVWNVSEIRVDDQRVRFLPVGTELLFSEIKQIEVPGWADRSDAPRNIIGSIVMVTKTNTTRLVPGAIVQWKNGCRIYTYGCDSDRLLSLLRQRLPER